MVRASRKPSCGRNTKLIHSILQQYSTFCSSLERDVKNYYFLLYEEFIEFAAEWNLDIGLDTSDGVKLRLSANQETFTEILNAVLKKIMSVPASTPFDMSDMIALSDSVFELYLQADKDGKFAAAATNLTLKGSIEIPAMTADSEATNISFDIGGAFYIESNLSDFSIPEGIAEDSSYQVIDDSFFN